MSWIEGELMGWDCQRDRAAWLQVHSGGLLRATPHYVQTAKGSAAVGVARNTLAIFMQPR